MAEDDVPAGPQIDVTAVSIEPDADFLPIEEQWKLGIFFSPDTALSGYHWRVTYVVDTSKRRMIVEVGATDKIDYAAGPNQMEFLCPRFDVSGVPPDILAQNNGMLTATLTGPDGEKPLAVNLVVKVEARDGMLVRKIFNPMD
mmetsp:Transcript_128341/g.256338  ORF Transcript_128341/g.256338 Transcript_128341/m.256338 type:complete len:143 (-) Transcript_128341:134-562(-)|eukprot:CAMPEP_0172720360 /NCGR_PEP_ID=MMETSP1074-20121228/76723_1 /TAXON_ID=2916 /ORGANISM="Ceratium fusus, Strain PA161109" /LENGTH=142 /DNA_ID=CAMNT_0013545867 /DNA_START=103 /DNA_END=531 /DNA_ORIENTATION=-